LPQGLFVANCQFTAVIEQGENSVCTASCPGLQRCHLQGGTREKAVDNPKDTIRLHIEARQSLGEPIPVEVAVERIEICG